MAERVAPITDRHALGLLARAYYSNFPFALEGIRRARFPTPGVARSR